MKDSELRQRQRGDLPPQRYTIVAVVSAVVAFALTLPMYIESFSWSGSRGITPWKGNFWLWAFFIGPISMFLGLGAILRERRRGSRRGWWLALSTVLIAALGAFLFVSSWVVAEREGLGL